MFKKYYPKKTTKGNPLKLNLKFSRSKKKGNLKIFLDFLLNNNKRNNLHPLFIVFFQFFYFYSKHRIEIQGGGGNKIRSMRRV